MVGQNLQLLRRVDQLKTLVSCNNILYIMNLLYTDNTNAITLLWMTSDNYHDHPIEFHQG